MVLRVRAGNGKALRDRAAVAGSGSATGAEAASGVLAGCAVLCAAAEEQAQRENIIARTVSIGCLVFNTSYPCDTGISLPSDEQIADVLDRIREYSASVVRHEGQREHLSRMVVWYSRRYLVSAGLLAKQIRHNNRVALFSSFKRAYLSRCWIWKNCNYDCQGTDIGPPRSNDIAPIRGPCTVDLNIFSKELFAHE